MDSIINSAKSALNALKTFTGELAYNLWIVFATAVMVVCIVFFLYYLHKVYLSKTRDGTAKLSKPDFPDEAALEGDGQPENWLELELLGLSGINLNAEPDNDETAPQSDSGAGETGKICDDLSESAEENAARYSMTHRLEEPQKHFHKPFPMTKRDVILMVIITAVYAVIAFWKLGSFDTPQSFAVFGGDNTEAVIELSYAASPASMTFYTGLGTGYYSISFSDDNINYSHVMDIEQKYSELLKWQTVDFTGESDTETAETELVKYIKITALNEPLLLGEVALFSRDGALLYAVALNETARCLLDESELPRNADSYLHNSYFDEIYHARTAYENILNIYPYEVSHPPLGKLIIAAGIAVFGMNPFGWRFMGTLFGVLMLPIIYIFIKNLFGKPLIACCGTLLFAFDFMHFVQTRIATIDTYGVFFILLMSYFMYRYFVQDYDTPFLKTLPPLFLSGFFFGIGAASKWTVIYGGAALFAVFILRQVLRGRYSAKTGRLAYYFGCLIATLGAALLFFVVIPSAVYILSYIPYGLAKDMSLSDGMLWDPRYLGIVWENQEFMLSYHGGLEATHPYSSPWWMWVINLRPILYFLKDLGNGTRSEFAAFGNPLVWWTGIAAMLSMAIAAVKKRDKLALFILIGYLAQLIPWILISRIAFIYHYFPNVIFIVLGISHMFNDICESSRNKVNLSVPLFTISSISLFVVFYPVLTGAAVDIHFAESYLRWFQGMWPF